MTPGDEALITTIASAIAAFAGMVAAGAAVVAIALARRSLKEGHATIVELQQLREAAQAETQAERATTVTLHMVLAEERAARELELLREVAGQVFQVTRGMQAVRDSRKDCWHELNDAKGLLSAQLAGFGEDELLDCRHLAGPQSNPTSGDNPEVRAAIEIEAAIGQARKRLVDVTAVANAQLKQIADSAVLVFSPGDSRATPPG